MRGHADSVTGLSLSSEGSYLLSNAMDNTGNFGEQLFWGWGLATPDGVGAFSVLEFKPGAHVIKEQSLLSFSLHRHSVPRVPPRSFVSELPHICTH